MVRQRSRPGQGPGKAKRALCRKDSTGSMSENPFIKDEGLYTSTINTHLYYNAVSPQFRFLCDVIVLFAAGWTETLPDTPVDETPPGPEVPEKIKKRYRKKKTKLEEAFPAYLQARPLG